MWVFTARAQCPITVDAGPDKYVCQPNTPVQINGSINGPYLSYVWTPTTRLSPSTSLTPTATVVTTTTYTLTAKAVEGSNLISNGNFESGNVDFSSDYNYSPGNLWPEGTYDILSNPQSSHANFQPCSDHTGGGQMMVINGAGTPGVDVWCSSVTVDPNTEYVFSVWAASVLSSSPAILQFSINGVLLGTSFSLPSTPCAWVRFYATWNSGSNGAATICLVNQNTAQSGNDFAIDDLFFSPVCQEMDEVTVNVVNVQAVAAPSTYVMPCNNAKITISGLGSSEGNNISHLWTTTNGHIVSGENTLEPEVDKPGVYTLTVTFNDGNVVCTKTANVFVNVSPTPPSANIPLPDELTCLYNEVELSANTNLIPPLAYHWTTSNGNIQGSPDDPECIATKAGQYFVTITSTSTGCTATANVLVFSNTTPPVARAAGAQLSCVAPTASLLGVGSSAGANIRYMWSTTNGAFALPPGNMNSAASAAGTYTLLVTNLDNGCTATATTTVTSNFAPAVVNVPPAFALDCATPSTNIAAGATPANASYVWAATNGGVIQSGQGTSSILVNTGGTYSVIATNPASGCRDTAYATVTSDKVKPTLQIAAPGQLDCDHQQVTLSAAGSSSGNNFNVAWTAGTGGHIFSGGNTLTPVVDAAATYTLLITNTINHCTATNSVQVIGDTNAVHAQIVVPGPLSCANVNLVLSSAGSSTGGPITRSWLDANGAVVGTGDSLRISTPGNYRLLLHNTANACRDTAYATVVRDTIPPNLSAAIPAVLNCAVSSVQLSAQNSAAGTFTYNWSTGASNAIVSGQGTLTPTVRQAGTYTLIAANTVNGCRDTISTAVSVDTVAPVSRVVTPPVIDCLHPVQNIAGTGSSAGAGFVYNWSAANGGRLLSGQGTSSVDVDAAGVYTLLITNTNNHCTASATTNVGIDTVRTLIRALPEDTLTCTKTSAIVRANGAPAAGGLTYNWTDAAGTAIGSAAQITVQTPGLYHLAVQNTVNGCTSTASAQVPEDKTAPQFVITPPAVLNCTLKETTLNVNNLSPSRTLAYTWSGTGIVGGNNSATPLVNAAGQYGVTATDGSNGCTATSVATVTKDDTPPLAQVAPPDTLDCVTPSLLLDAGASTSGNGISYLWATTGGNISQGQSTQQLLVNKPGSYQLIVTNEQNHCADTTSVLVTQDLSTATADAGLPDTLTCKAPALVLQGQSDGIGGNFTYAWSGLSAPLVNGQNTLSPTVDKPGAYVLTVTKKSNGCVRLDTVQILENKIPPQVTIARPDTLTCAITSVVLQASTQGQGTTVALQWSGPGVAGTADQHTLNTNQTGVYRVHITDPVNGCVADGSATVVENKVPPTLQIAPADTITCAAPAVTIKANATGQSTNLQVQWTTANGRFKSGENTLSPAVDLPGDYQVTITDLKNGCKSEGSVTVNQNAAFPQMSAGTPPTLTCFQPQVALQGTMEPGPNMQAVWTTTGGHFVGAANILTPQIDVPGTYTLSVTNRSTGCTSSATIAVTEDKVKPLANAGPSDTLKCSLAFLRLNAQASEPATDFKYTWTTPNGNLTGDPTLLQPTVDAPGIYILTVQNRTNGCTATSQVEILRDQKAPLADAGQPANLTCAVRQLTLKGNASTGSGITYQWQTANGTIVNGDKSLSPLISRAGTYQLLVSDATNGCKSLASVTIGEDTIPPAAGAGTATDLTCVRTSLSLQGTAMAAGNPPLTYQWTSADGRITGGAATLSPTLDRPGTYVLNVRNELNGCSTTRQVTVGIDTLRPVLSAGQAPTLTCAVREVQLTTSVLSSAHPQYQIRWTPLTGGHIANGDTTLTPVVDKAASYRLLVTDRVNGCTATASVPVSENIVPPLANAGAPVFLTCTAPSTNLNGSGSSQGPDYSYQWTGAQLLGGATTLAPTIGAAGTYVLQVLDRRNGCSSTATVTAADDKKAPAAVVAQAGTLTCTRDSIVLNAAGSGSSNGFTSQWTTVNGHFRAGAQTLSPVVDQPGLYLLTVKDNRNGCTATAEMTVPEDKVSPNAQIKTPEPLTCLANSVTLQGSSSTNATLRYLWTAPSTGSVLSPTDAAALSVGAPGVYRLQVTNAANGCTTTTTTTVIRLAPPAFLAAVQQPDCHGPLGAVALQVQGGDAPPFRYSLNNAVPQSIPSFEDLKPGVYVLRMRDAIGCEVSKNITINTPFIPVLRIPSVSTLDLGDSVQLKPIANLPNSSVSKWEWTPAEGLSCSNCPRPVAKPIADAEYTLTMTDLNGCTASAVVELLVSRDRHVWAPNIFSPNGDGLHDYFTIYGQGVEEVRFLRIFDRWGNQVFLTEHIPVNEDRVGWDGTFSGEPLVPAVFVWVAEVIFLDGQRKLLKGDVTIWR